MKRLIASVVALAMIATTSVFALDQLSKGDPDGTKLGQSTTDKLGFFGVTTVVQPSGATQGALTDSSAGTAAPTTGVSANAQKEVIILPIGQLSLLVNAQTWKVAIPYAFQVTAANFRTGQAVVTGSKLANLSTQINGVVTTGGAIALTSTAASTTGGSIAGSAITGANTGTAGQTLEVGVSSVTAFLDGTGWVEFTIINVDKANQSATFASLCNAIRTALLNLGLIKGGA